MSYRQEILKPFYDALIALGYEKKRFGLVAAIADPVKPWKKNWYVPKVENNQYRKPINDDFIDVVISLTQGTDKVFTLTLDLAIIALSIERQAAEILECQSGGFDGEGGPGFTITSILISRTNPMRFAESKNEEDILQVSNLISMLHDVAVPFFQSHVTIESLLPSLRADESSMIARYVSLPLALISLKRHEEAFAHLVQQENLITTRYRDMPEKLKRKFPELR